MICKRCGEDKEESEFYPSDIKHGVTRCKNCRLEMARQFNGLSPETSREHYRMKAKRETLRNPIKRWATSTISGHKKRGCEIRFTTQELIELAEQTTHCKYCGKEIVYKPYEEVPVRNRPSMDRINNDTELRIDNIQIICNGCNISKGQMTHDEFILYCKNIASRW